MPSYGLNIGYLMDHIDLLGTSHAPVSKIPSVKFFNGVSKPSKQIVNISVAAFFLALNKNQFTFNL